MAGEIHSRACCAFQKLDFFPRVRYLFSFWVYHSTIDPNSGLVSTSRGYFDQSDLFPFTRTPNIFIRHTRILTRQCFRVVLDRYILYRNRRVVQNYHRWAKYCHTHKRRKSTYKNTNVLRRSQFFIAVKILEKNREDILF